MNRIEAMHITDIRIWIPVSLLLILGFLVYLLSPVLSPFVMGALLAYLSDPLIERLQKWGLSRTLAVSLVFLVLTLLVVASLLVLVPLLSDQISAFFSRVPAYLDRLEENLTTIVATLGIDLGSLNFKQIAKEYLPQASSLGSQILRTITQSGGAIISGMVVMFLTPIVTFYMLRDWGEFLQHVRDLIPHQARDTLIRLVKQSDTMLSAFIRGQLLVMTSLGLIYSAGLMLIGLPFALLIGFVAGLLSFIPYLGTFVGVVLAAAVYVAEYQNWLGLWQVGIIFIIGQSLEGYFLTPWLVGDKIGLHPVVVIFAVLAGGQLFGFVGVLLALPVSAVLAVLIREAVSRYKQSELYLEGRNGEEETGNPT